MEALPTELRRELIKRVFPDLRYGGDPDIERYFEFRRDGRLGEALALYNGPLRARYPDDQSRILLLRLYRENDPRWKELQDRLILKLAGRIAASISHNVDLLVEPIAATRLSNAFRALSAVESVLRVVPATNSDDSASGRNDTARSDEVLSFLDRYVSLARLLRYRAGEMEKARELVGEYLAMARADAPAEYDFIARSKAIEERRREAERLKAAQRGSGREGGRETAPVDFAARSGQIEEARRLAEKEKKRYFDLSKIEFSAVDRARIEIPANIERREDKVLAYCWKYWELVADPGFGRLVFLYSKKFGTPHYAIFRTVQLGRMRRSTDDEILTAVSAILSTSYSYSVSGDLYMQAAWRRLKARVEAEKAEIAGASRDREELIRSRTRAESEAASRRAVLRSPSAAEERAEAIRKAAVPSPVARTTPETRNVETTEVAGRRSVEPHDGGRRTPQAISEEGLRLTSRLERDVSRDEATVRSRAAAPAPMAPATQTAAPEPLTRRARDVEPARTESLPPEAVPRAETPRTALKPVGKRKKSPGLDTVRLRPPESAVERLSARTGSISDRIKKLSGKAYDVYQQIFFQGVRNDIHRCLVSNRTHAFRLFDESANEAEDIIFAFMQEHYTDPFMNWEGSDERASVEALGFALPSLDPIIEAWFRRL